MNKKTQEAFPAFLSLLRVGLWEDEVKVNDLPEDIDYDEILHLAQVQSVVGLVTAGAERLTTYSFDKLGASIPLTEKLKFLGHCQLIEQRNAAMNHFIEDLMCWLQKADIKALLVKGQGVAQCYARPRWRSSGDVDLLLGNDYKRAVELLSGVASKVEKENPFNLHQAMTLDSWSVELHGSLRGLLKKRLDKIVDEVQIDTFKNKRVRIWHNGSVDVFLPVPDNDVIFVFSHILQHFFKETVSLRQICDWCRLLWTYKDEIDRALLENRLRQMKVLSEWKAFAALAVDHLGMPIDAMPLYTPSKYRSRKGNRILMGILNDGNTCNINLHLPSDFINSKLNSFWQHTKVGFQHFVIFPLDSLIVWINMIVVGVMVVMKSSK